MGMFDNILSSDESLFLNAQFLDIDFTPPIIKYRENEQQYIAECIKPVLQKRNGRNLLVVGGHGIGKTLGIKHVLESLKEEHPNEVNCVYVNCWIKDTAFKVAHEICSQLKYTWTHNKSMDQLMDKASELLNEKSAVIVLDEIDKLEDEDLIYNLVEQISRKIIILITNNKEFLKELDERIKSRLMPETLEFKQYNKQETEGILKQRLEYAFVQGTFDKEAFNDVVEKTFEIGDIRVGLFLMKEAGEIAETKSSRKITKEHVDLAISKLQEFKIKKLDEMNSSEKELLEIIKNNSGKTTSEICKLYFDKTKKSERTFYRKLNELQKANSIILKEMNKGFEEGKSTIIEYNITKTLKDY